VWRSDARNRYSSEAGIYSNEPFDPDVRGTTRALFIATESDSMSLASLFGFGKNAGSHDVDSLGKRLRRLRREGALELPLPARGKTPERHAALYEFGRKDLSIARMVEAHADALAILADADVKPRDEALYGIWALDGMDSKLFLEEGPNGCVQLTGMKRHCCGTLLVDAALVTAHHGDDLMLVDVSMKSKGISIDASEWSSPAFNATAMGSVRFKRVIVEPSQIVGIPGWYRNRPGFWHGAIGPAACWAGGAAGLVEAARNVAKSNPHVITHFGALEAAVWGLNAILEQAGRQIDADPSDTSKQARTRALSARHLIERTCVEVMDHFGRATGPALLGYDAAVAQRFAELTLYMRQSDAERDLQLLAGA
jgi:hypothetical protein